MCRYIHAIWVSTLLSLSDLNVIFLFLPSCLSLAIQSHTRVVNRHPCLFRGHLYLLLQIHEIDILIFIFSGEKLQGKCFRNVSPAVLSCYFVIISIGILAIIVVCARLSLGGKELKRWQSETSRQRRVSTWGNYSTQRKRRGNLKRDSQVDCCSYGKWEQRRVIWLGKVQESHPHDRSFG